MTKEEILDWVLEAEGGFVDNPLDKGGPTNMGITFSSFADWKRKNVTVDDLKAITKQDACKFYVERFWNPMGLDKVPSWRMRLVMMDYGVNRGVTRAVSNVEQIAGEQDVKAAAKYVFRAQRAYCEIVKLNPSQAVFIKGWINRTQRLLFKILFEVGV